MSNCHPKCAEMQSWSIHAIQAHLDTCLGTRDGLCIPGINALGTAKHQRAHEQALHRIAKREKTVSGQTRHKNVMAAIFGIILGTHDEFGKPYDKWRSALRAAGVGASTT